MGPSLRILLIALIARLLSGSASAETDPLGVPLNTSLSLEVVGGVGEWHGLAEDSRHWIYAATDSEIRFTRGEGWETLPGVPSGPIDNIMIGPDDRLHIALMEDTGWIELRGPQTGQWRSIQKLLPAKQSNNRWVIAGTPATGDVFYRTDNQIVAISREGAMREWKFDQRIRFFLQPKKGRYVVTENAEIYRLEPDGQATLLPTLLARHAAPGVKLNGAFVRATCELSDGHSLLAINQYDLFLFDGEALAPCPTGKYPAPPTGSTAASLNSPTATSSSSTASARSSSSTPPARLSAPTASLTPPPPPLPRVPSRSK